jgi:hypothetical protein
MEVESSAGLLCWPVEQCWRVDCVVPRAFGNAGNPCFVNLFFLLKFNFFLYILDYFDILILKIIFLKKNIILIYFKIKNILKTILITFLNSPKAVCCCRLELMVTRRGTRCSVLIDLENNNKILMTFYFRKHECNSSF